MSTTLTRTLTITVKADNIEDAECAADTIEASATISAARFDNPTVALAVGEDEWDE